jgi:nucleoside 2-deoxyribosyltransferase
MSPEHWLETEEGRRRGVIAVIVSLACAVLLADFAAIRSCDAILLLENWDTSKGAKTELLHALSLGKIVYDFTACDLNVLKKELKEEKHHGCKS